MKTIVIVEVDVNSKRGELNNDQLLDAAYSFVQAALQYYDHGYGDSRTVEMYESKETDGLIPLAQIDDYYMGDSSSQINSKG